MLKSARKKSTEALISAYEQLSDVAKHVLHLLAVYDEQISRTEIAKLSGRVGWTDTNKKSLSTVSLQAPLQQLENAGFARSGSYSRWDVVESVRDFAVQQAIHAGTFGRIAKVIDAKRKRRPATTWGSPDLREARRDTRIAFYRGDLTTFRQQFDYAVKGDQNFRLLHPFDTEIFEQIDPELKGGCLTSAVWAAVLNGEGSASVLEFAEAWLATRTQPTDVEEHARLALAIARGDLHSLDRLAKQSGFDQSAAAGCRAFLIGDYDTAEQCLDAEHARLKKSSRKRNVVLPDFCGLFHMLLKLRHRTPATGALIASMQAAAKTAWRPEFVSSAQLVLVASKYDQTPEAMTRDRLQNSFAATAMNNDEMGFVVGAYLWKWFLSDGRSKSERCTSVTRAAKVLKKLGLTWLAAFMEDAAACITTAEGDIASSRLHAKTGTKPIITLLQPEPVWKRTLKAIGQLIQEDSCNAPAETSVAHAERLIWELTCSTVGGWVDAKPFIQKRTARGWTKGRPVALSRLYNDSESTEFEFLTDEDRRLCRAIECQTEKNRYGYTETRYHFEFSRAITALIGHPRLYAPGNRETTIDIVARDPQLVVQKEKTHVTLQIEPSVPTGDGVAVLEDGPDRLTVVTFTADQSRLAGLLQDGLVVPADAADQVMQTVQSIAPLISVQSDIKSSTIADATKVNSNSRPHLQLIPYQSGLRAEFFVRPIGDGPFYRPGEGGASVFASVGGQSFSAARDLAMEKSQMNEVISRCDALASRFTDDAVEFHFPTTIEALELMVSLEPLVESNAVEVHWPQGKSLTLAGHVSSSQFRVHIRKDRDWFAASGKLTVNRDLALDMMQLMELLSASPSRFVKLDDGRYLALTEQLRRRIEQFSAFGDPGRGKVRFPAIRAAAFLETDDSGDEEAMRVRSDAHWKKCLERIRAAGQLRPELPKTLQVDLRDYQREGFDWLCRLAHMGAGGCLADDMGLGKTIQALALLTARSADGPALVVAPASVGFNWVSEATRFAPTLNVQLFGPGDRDEIFRNIGPRDVIVTTYGLLHSESARFHDVHWHTAILDEAQAIKNAATQRSQTAMGLTADFRMIMTGTPLENHLGELWNLFQFINPGLLGTLEQFNQRFAIPIERDGQSSARANLKRLIQPFILRRTKSQVLKELPSRTEVTLQVELSDDEIALYEALRRKAIETLAKETDKRGEHLRILGQIMKLRRVCCHPDLVAPEAGVKSSRLELFCSTLDELLANNHKALVFSQFVDHLTILREELERRQIPYQYLDGSTPTGERKKRVEAFQNGEGDVFLISLKAGGSGLNLTAADYVLHMDPWWNPAVEDQASDRAHRIGQKRPVTIYRFVAQGTIEERIVDLHAQKRDLADSLLDGSDISGKLSAQELLSLITS
ncbi:MAG: DEAD/DEAH box helicase [Fuerstiella sp.]